ncbi:MAG: hypothetical protein HY290_05155 [Planctomycetia bacterium]|nr:hypothetical protein [Planctomycetia bacterium]
MSTPLSQTDVERFLAVVQNHEDALIPEFTPPDDDDPPDFTLPAKDIVACFRGKFRRVFDVERQGSVWERDEHWKQALSTQKISGARFASLVRNVSLAIMRVRLEARVDVSQLVTNAKRDVARATRIINQIDAAPPADQTRESKALRSRSAVELGRAVALLQFAELIQQIPDESGAQVRRFSARLKALLPARANEDLLAELSDLAVRDENTIERAGYEVEADESPRRSAGTRR